MFTLSYTEAMTIQRAQAVWYRQAIGRKGFKTIRKRTKPCPPDIHPNEPIDVCRINELVPRGASFESYIRHFPAETDETRMAWHDAIRKGLL